jgi:hypothetical protein
MRPSFRLALVSTLFAAACSSGPGTIALNIPPQCNPLRGDDPLDCATPYPSLTYEQKGTSNTGMLLDIPPASAAAKGEPTVLPTSVDGVPIDPTAYNTQDGFSPAAPIIVHFKEGIDPSNLPPPTDLAMSLDPASPTQLLDTDGNRVVQFSEVNVNATDPTREGMYIRPQIRLKPKSTYVVVVLKTVHDSKGNALPVPQGMQALLDGTPTDNARLEALRPEYAQVIFPTLAKANIDKSQVLLAWDYTTASDELLVSHVQTMRDLALAAIGDGSNVQYTIATNEPGYGSDGTLYTRLTGTFKAPLFLKAPAGQTCNTSDTCKTGVLNLVNGVPVQNGTYDVPFAILAPAKMTSATTANPLPVLVFGHGLLGSAISYSTDSTLRADSQQFGVVMAMTDWTGLSMNDINTLQAAISDLNQMPTVTDKLQQAIVNNIVMLRWVRTALGNDPALKQGGMNVLSPTTAYYYGISLGGIMGGSFMGYDPDITRGVLNVPGGDWSLMMERSIHWAPLDPLLTAEYPDTVDQQVLLSYMQSFFDYSDPITVDPYLIGGSAPLSGVPPKQVLLQEGLHDCQVPNLATEMVSRTLGISQLTPTDHMPYGIPTAAGPLTSALTVYDFNVSFVPPTTNAVFNTDNGVHDDVYQTANSTQQVADFLEGGNAQMDCPTQTGCICHVPASGPPTCP